MQNNKPEKLELYWLCNETGRKHSAGVAFFNNEKGDYRLKIDVLPEDKVFYLKPIGAKDGTISYRVEAAVRKNGLVTHRAQVGNGFSKSENGYPVFMDIGPFTRTLMLDKE